MKIRLFFASLFSLIIFSVQGQDMDVSVHAGFILQSFSEILNEEREIQIYLPPSYSHSDSSYPVLYVLDGSRYFLHAVSLQNSISSFKETPEFIVVGISKSETERNSNFSSNSQLFTSYLQKEVIDFVDAKYRTSKDRLVFGWAYAGGFLAELLSSQPKIFQTFILASPYPLENKLENLELSFSKETESYTKLIAAYGSNEESVAKEMIGFEVLLKEKAPKTLDWKVLKLEGVEHRATPYLTLYKGIRSHFDYYPEIQFSNLDEFLAFGGLENVDEYYKQRSENFGFEDKLSDWTMFSITRNAIRANDFLQFSEMMNEFESTDFLQRLRPSRSYQIAKYYFDNNQIEKAKQIFESIVKFHPEFPSTYDGLGDYYAKKGNKKQATHYYNLAKEISKK